MSWLSDGVTATDPPLRAAAVWIERFRGFWDSSFDRLDAHLATLQQEQESR